MNLKSILIFAFSIILLCSCVSKKKYNKLWDDCTKQGNDFNEMQVRYEMQKDSLLNCQEKNNPPFF